MKPDGVIDNVPFADDLGNLALIRTGDRVASLAARAPQSGPPPYRILFRFAVILFGTRRRVADEGAPGAGHPIEHPAGSIDFYCFRREPGNGERS